MRSTLSFKYLHASTLNLFKLDDDPVEAKHEEGPTVNEAEKAMDGTTEHTKEETRQPSPTQKENEENESPRKR